MRLLVPNLAVFAVSMGLLAPAASTAQVDSLAVRLLPDTTSISGFGQRVPVKIVKDRLAVRLRTHLTKKPLEDLLDRHGQLRKLPVAELEVFRDQGIVTVRLRDGLPITAYVDVFMSLVRDQAVDYVGPIALLGEGDVPHVMTPDIMVRFRPGVTAQSVRNEMPKLGLSVVRASRERPGAYVLRRRAGVTADVFQLADHLSRRRDVLYAHPDFYPPTVKRTSMASAFIPNDPLFGEQWHLHNTGQLGGKVDADVDAPEAWEFTLGKKDVVIALLDDGVSIDHPDLQPNVVAGGRDFVAPRDADPRPGPGDAHGTAVAGLAVARGNNSEGVSGTCPECGLLALRMVQGSYADHADAFDYAVQKKADVINCSFGYADNTAALPGILDAIENAAQKSVVVFAMSNIAVDDCAGNLGAILKLPNVIAVSSSTSRDAKVPKSGFGDCTDVLGPSGLKLSGTGGAPILTVATTDSIAGAGYNPGFDDCPIEEFEDLSYTSCFSGTSAASPVVAGIAGLVLSINPQLTPAQVEAILKETADKIDAQAASYDGEGHSDTHGHGRVNAHRAVVPTAHVAVTPSEVKPGEQFTVTVTGTAPAGVHSVGWRIEGGGSDGPNPWQWQAAPSQPVFRYTWTSSIDKPGTYSVLADARDVAYPGVAGDTYPHSASKAIGEVRVTIKVASEDKGCGGVGILFFAAIVMAGLIATKMSRLTVGSTRRP